MKYSTFEQFPIWQSAIDLTIKIYTFSERGAFRQDFGLKDQIRRASVSVSANIAEGFDRENNNELIRFLKIAKGSSGEVRNFLYIARKIGYISEADFRKLHQETVTLSKQISGFVKYLKEKRAAGEFIKK